MRWSWHLRVVQEQYHSSVVSDSVAIEGKRENEWIDHSDVDVKISTGSYMHKIT